MTEISEAYSLLRIVRNTPYGVAPARFARSVSPCYAVLYCANRLAGERARSASGVLHRVVEKSGAICLRILEHLINNDKQY